VLLLLDLALCDNGGKMKQIVTLPYEANGWKISGTTDYDPKTVFRYMDGAAELYLAYNMKKLTVVQYEKPGHPSITAEVYYMGSSEDTFGIFSFQLDDPEAGIGQGSGFGGGLLRFWKGRNFINIYGESPGAHIEAAILYIGRQIDGSIKDMASPLKILSYLPEGEAPFIKSQAWFLRSHILLNQRFFVAQNNVLGLEKDTEAVLGRYGTGKERGYILLVKYPARKKAETAFLNFRRLYMPEASEMDSIKTENNRWTLSKDHGSFVVIVFDAPDQPFAQKLIRHILVRLQREEE